MYGLVNKAIQDLVVSSCGEDAWLRIKKKAGIAALEFVEVSNYDDDLTYSLVSISSAELDIPADQILFDFGRHWILFTGREGWDSLFSLGGDSVKAFLLDLDNLHARVQVAMPEARMPRFSVFETENGLEVQYRSDRDGLAPMVSGMLSGLAERFNERWEIEHTNHRAQQGFDTFQLRQVQCSTDDGLVINAA